MCTYIYMYTYVCTFVNVYTVFSRRTLPCRPAISYGHICIYASTQTYTLAQIYKYICIYICTYIYIYMFIYIHIFVRLIHCFCTLGYVYIYIHIHTYINVHVYTYLYTCTFVCILSLRAVGLVVPVPPQSILIFFFPSKGYCAWMFIEMCLKPTIAPIWREFSHCETAPCS